MSYYPEFAHLLEKYLSETDRSASWVAQRLGVNPATVTRWRNGDNRPKDPEMVDRLADVLGLHDKDQRQELMAAAGYAFIESVEPTSDVGEERVESVQDNDAISEFDDETVYVAGAQPLNQQVLEDDINGNSKLASPQIWHLIPAKSLLIWLLIAVAVFTGIGLWNLAGQPGFRSTASTRKFSIGNWENLSPGTSPLDEVLTSETRRVLYQKLSASGALRGIRWDESTAISESSRLSDLWIEGTYKNLDLVELSASIFEGPEQLFLDTVTTKAEIDHRRSGVDICILDIQTELAKKILAVLGVTLDANMAVEIEQTPTTSCEALILNNDAVILASQGNYQSAQIKLNRASAIDPDYADVYNNLGWILGRQDEKVQAVDAYRRATELQPMHPLYWFNLGLAYEDTGALTMAVEAYQQAIRHDPAYTKAYNNLGYTYLLMDELADAEAQIQEGIKLNSQAPYLHKNLGRVFLAQERFAEAVDELTLAIELFDDGTYAEALYYLALVHQKLDDVQSTCDTLQRYLGVADFDAASRREDANELTGSLQCQPRPSE